MAILSSPTVRTLLADPAFLQLMHGGKKEALRPENTAIASSLLQNSALMTQLATVHSKLNGYFS
jgi:hypothetical protein